MTDTDLCAERYLLGACLLDVSAFRSHRDLVAAAFYEPKHRRLWSALQRLDADGHEPSGVAVIGARMLPSGDGWPELVHDLCAEGADLTPAATLAARQRVEESHVRRVAAATLTDAKADLLSGRLSPSEISTRLAAIPSGATHQVAPAPLSTVPELSLRVQDNTPWVWHGYLARGEVTLLAGREKMGKSTFVFGLLHAMTDLRYFVEQATERVPVIYLTEESPTTILEKCRLLRVGDGVHFLPRTDAPRDASFHTLVDRVLASAEKLKAGLVIIDTLTHWGGLGPEAENHAGAVQAIYLELQRLAAAGLAVLLVHHLAKGAGEVRGSTAITSGADIVMRLMGVKGDKYGRSIFAVGRHPETKSAVQVRLVDWNYCVVDHREEPEPQEKPRR